MLKLALHHGNVASDTACEAASSARGRGALRRLAPLALIVPLLGSGCAWLPGLEDTNEYAYGPGNGLQYASMSDGEYVGADIADVADVGGDNVVSSGDPLEPFNRFMFAINDTLDIFIMRPLAVTYRRWAPDLLRDVVDNFVTNLSEPVTFANALLQGDMEHAETTGSRFLINSAIGFGMFDPATGMGLKHRDEDFGQTMAVWGAPSGPYLVLPLFGPATVRSAAGRGVDFFLDPFVYFTGNPVLDMAGVEIGSDDYAALGLGRTFADTLTFRAQNIETLDQVRSDAIDYYARIRSLWMQQRRREILNQVSDEPRVSGLEPAPATTEPTAQVSAN
jgi:phospholipid-binding lipoprotein MlaA